MRKRDRKARKPRGVPIMAAACAIALALALLACRGCQAGRGADAQAAGGGAATSLVDDAAEDEAGPAEDAGAAGSAGRAAQGWTGRSLEEAATSELEAYRDQGGCVLVRAGYADFLGNVWSALVQGDGWVEICIVRRGSDGAGSQVSHTRLDAGDWQERLSP